MIRQRIKSLQKEMISQGIDLYYFNTSDYHMSEYVPEHFKTIAYFSGFTGSLATLLISRDAAYIFVDGRYHLQADKQCTKYGINVVKLGTASGIEPIDFILKYHSNSVVGIDGKRTSVSFAKQLLKHKIKIKSVDIYSKLIQNRVPLVNSHIRQLSLKYTGLTRKKKIELIQYVLKDTCHIINNLESIAYILNLRGNDIKYTPVFLSYLIFLDKKVYLFVDEDRFDEETLDSIYDDDIIIRPYDNYYDFLKLIKNKKITIDPNRVNYETYIGIKDKNKISYRRSVVEDMKAIKNTVEQKNIKQAHIYDGIAMLRFMMWLKSQDKTNLNEYDVAKKLDAFRKNYKAFDISFNTIVGYNENSAIIHYGPTKENSSKLDNKGILLIDSGGQYNCGTTDVTRTISLGRTSNEVKKYFTLVLKSMFSLSEIRFMKGIGGNQIDIIARQELWNEGLDFRHGTGHGVGYVNSVHEGSPNIRYMHTETKNEEIELKPGMVVSDEPGVYFDNKFGIRCENLLLVKEDIETEYGQFLKFETLTLIPFDLDLIDKQYLDEKTRLAINDYHQMVYDTLVPYLDEKEEAFLKRATRKI